MKTIDIWNGNAPYGGGSVQMHCYEPEVKKGDGAVIIFSGGGYSHRAYHEAEPYALELNRMGLLAFVVDYRVMPKHYLAPLSDAQRAVSYVRRNAAEYGISPDKIAVMGSSAGGHLAALCAVFKCGCLEGDWLIDNTIDYWPDAQILCYPVIDFESHNGSYDNLLGDWVTIPTYPGENNTVDKWHYYMNPIAQVDNDVAPPAFIWHTSCDETVDVKGTYRYATRLSELGASVEMHIYPVGCHGLGLATGDPKREPVEYVQRWIEDLERWLKLIGWITE